MEKTANMIMWENLNRSEDGSRHPDERMIRVPAMFCQTALALAGGFDIRSGSGHVLPDGIWFDPFTKDYYACKTLE
jgi:hypothetical protein